MGPIAQDNGQAIAPSWADYDRDGDLDLFVTQLRGLKNVLYRNDGNAGFTRIADVPPVESAGEHIAAGWGDYDNDGWPDLFVNDFGFGTRLYRNLGGGKFSAAVNLIPASGGADAYGGGWADSDLDGRLDLAIGYGGGGSRGPTLLWQQLPGTVFEVVQAGSLSSSPGFTMALGWADFDGDLLPDLYVAKGGNDVGVLFRNTGKNSFDPRTQAPFDSQATTSSTAAWGDYDNDGDLDLFVGHSAPARSAFYRNEGGGSFVPISNLALTDYVASTVGAMWGDYDNDGWLDLYVANRGTRNLLFRNLGHGVFQEITDDPAAQGAKASNGMAWGDYDNDGFLDLVVANWDSQTSDLFHNRGNAHGWLKVQCRGTTSNADGIGAKVRIVANIRGESVHQMREIRSGDGWGGAEVIAHFGLGDATSVQRLLVEWPSGITQELTQIDARQRLTVVEPPPSPLAISPPAGLFTNVVTVRLSTTVRDAAIRYTLDASEPTLSSPLYSQPLELSRTTTLKARLFFNGFPASDILTAVYRADPGVAILPPGGFFTNRIDVVLATRLLQSTLHYTVDGTDPTADSPTYSGPFPLTAQTTVKTRAIFNGFPVSDIVSATFHRVYVFEDDGIPPTWREGYFGADFRIDPRAQHFADPDRDGSDNRQEFLAGSDPLDPTSGFLVGVRALPEIRFPSVPGIKYRILRRASVVDPAATVIYETVATGETTRFIDESADAMPHPSFYLVEPVR